MRQMVIRLRSRCAHPWVVVLHMLGLKYVSRCASDRTIVHFDGSFLGLRTMVRAVCMALAGGGEGSRKREMGVRHFYRVQHGMNVAIMIASPSTRLQRALEFVVPRGDTAGGGASLRLLSPEVCERCPYHVRVNYALTLLRLLRFYVLLLFTAAN